MSGLVPRCPFPAGGNRGVSHPGPGRGLTQGRVHLPNAACESRRLAYTRDWYEGVSR